MERRNGKINEIVLISHHPTVLSLLESTRSCGLCQFLVDLCNSDNGEGSVEDIASRTPFVACTLQSLIKLDHDRVAVGCNSWLFYFQDHPPGFTSVRFETTNSRGNKELFHDRTRN